MFAEAYQCLREEVLPALEKEGIFLPPAQGPDRPATTSILTEVFRREIFPVLTPLAIDPGHPFPHLLNKSLNLAVLLQRPRRREKLFAVVQVPAVLPRFVQLPTEKGYVFTPLETVIRLHLADLFPGMEIGARHRFPRHAQQRIRDRRRRSRGSAQDDRGGGAQAPARPSRCGSKSRPSADPRSSSS